MSNISAIIQARMGSSRLPNKVLSDIVGHPMLWHIINRIKKSRLIDDIIIATTINNEDDEIENFAKQYKIKLFRGDSNDVLDRFYQAARKFNVKDIARITADDAFKDPVVIDKVIGKYKRHNVDYASNTIQPTYPVGLDIEIFSYNSLWKAWEETEEKYEREHVTPYFYMNPKKFKILNVKYERGDLSHMRWTVDTPEDLVFVKKIYEKLYEEGKIFLMDDILNLLNKYPELSRMNKDEKGKNILAE